MPKVLIIEDDTLISRMYQQVFSFEGFEVVMVEDSLSGVERAKAEKPDIIFCDIMMPKMNGLEILSTLKSDAQTKSIPVVMLTNMSGTQDSKTAMDKGAYAYMVKSEFKPKEIAQKAKEFLDQISQAQLQAQTQTQVQSQT
ncbi:MAG: response regulator [Patescibacteria group bacterium]